MALTKISTAMISQSAAAVDLNVDAGTFYVDTTNNRVGVGGKTDPDTPLHVVGTATATLFAGSGASLTSIPNSALVNSSITINSTAVSLGGSLTLTTANIAENTNLYYTDARADARIAAADTDDLSEGSSNLYYTDARVDARVSGGSLGNITTTGYIRGPATFTIDPAAHGDNTGTVVIAGNLQVDGTQTVINSTTLTVDDKNITLASGSANAAAASGAGFTVDIGTGTNPAITYDGTNDEWDFNKPLNVTGTITAPSIQAASGSFSIKRSNDGTNAVQVLATGEVLIGANYLYVTASAGAYFSNAVRFRGTISNDTGTNVTFGQPINVTGGIKVGGNEVIDSSRNITAGDVNITSAAPTIFFTDSDGTNQNTTVKQSGGNFFIIARDNTANAGVVFAGNAGGTYDEYARFKADGNFGIRTNNPSETLELTRLGKIGFGMNGSYGARIGYFDDGGGTHGFHVDTKHSGTTVSESRFVVRADSGNVGIGTKNPNYKLEVLGHTGVRNGSFFIGTETGSNTGGIEFYVPVSAPNTLRIYRNVGAFGGTYSAQYAALDLYSGTAYNTRISGSGNSFLNGGNVGIGTDTPDSLLEIHKPSTNSDIDYLKMSMPSWSQSTSKLKSMVWDDSSNVIAGIGAEFSGGTTNIHFHSQYNGGYKATSVRTMSILGNGNVGIGTSSPGALLDVNDSGATNNAWNTLAKFRPDLSDSSAETSIHIQSYPSTTVVGDRRAGIQSIDDAGVARPLLLNKAGGNVGIGVATPSKKLHVYSADNEGIFMEGTGGGHWFNFKSGVSNLWSMGAQSGLMGWYNRTTGSYAMVIKDGGNVGIGTTSPAFKLVVAHNGRNGMEFVPNTDDAGTNIIQNYNRGTSAYTPLRIAGNSLTLLSGTNAQHSTSIDTSGNIATSGNINLTGGGTIEAPSVGGGEDLTLKAAGSVNVRIDSNSNGGDGEFFKVFRHAETDAKFSVQENGAVEVAGTLNSGGALSTTASVGATHFFKSTYSYGPNRDWAIRTNNYGSSNWGGWSLEQSGEAQGTPDIARIGVHANGNVGIQMGGAAGTGGTENPATPLHVGGDITVGTAESVGTGAASAIRFVNDNERSRITSNYASGGGGEMGFWTDTTGGTLLNRAYIKNDGSFNFNGPVKMHSNYWATNDVMKAYSITGPSSNSLTRTINVNTYWDFAAQGGAFMFMIHGWQSDSATGMVHWHNNGSNNPVISGVYLNEFHTATGLTVSVAKGTGDYDIDISLASTHTNTHGWYWKVWA